MSEIEVKNKKMTNCQTCGIEIAKSAKVCPSCGAKQKKKSNALVGILVVVIVIAIIAAAAGSGDEPKKVGDYTDGNSSNSGQTEKGVFYVGETVELKDVHATLVGVSESNGSTYNKPSDGNVYILCEFEIVNNSDEEIAVSSMLSFEAYCDDYACNYSLGALIEKGDKNQLDGTVAPGKKFNGVIGYEVPADWKEMEIKFTPDFWSGKDITFIAKND